MQALLEDIYPYLWLAYEDAGFADVITPPPARPPVVLSDIARELGVGAGSAVLDAGCGEGNHAGALAEQSGALVVGLDPVRACLRRDGEPLRLQLPVAKGACCARGVVGAGVDGRYALR